MLNLDRLIITGMTPNARPFIPNPNYNPTIDDNESIPRMSSKLNPNAPFFEPSHKNVEGNVFLPHTMFHDEHIPEAVEAEDLDEDIFDNSEEFVCHETRILQDDWNYGSAPPEWNSVDDFSSEWWELIQHNVSFRKYWSREYQGEASDIFGGEGYFLESEFVKENEVIENEVTAMRSVSDKRIMILEGMKNSSILNAPLFCQLLMFGTN